MSAIPRVFGPQTDGRKAERQRDRETEKERKGKKRIEDLKNGEMQQRILNLPSKSKGDILE